MSPAFAMGPAWTLMRSLSAHVSDEEADKATDIFVGAEKIESMARYRQMRTRDGRDVRCSRLVLGQPCFRRSDANGRVEGLQRLRAASRRSRGRRKMGRAQV